MLTIATFNIKNNYNDYNDQKANIIVRFLKNKKVDVLCFQELFDKCHNDLLKKVPKNYKFYGKYRYKLKIFRKINECVDILTNKNVIGDKTYKLPYLPSTLKRIVEVVDIKTKSGEVVSIINTHLDFKFRLSKKRQLKRIIRIIKSKNNKIVLTGDFNCKMNHDILKDFVKELEKLNIKRVNVCEKTLKCSKYNRAIDHVFVSNDIKVKSFEVVKDLPISDHYPIVVKVVV